MILDFDQLRIVAILAAFFMSLFNRLEGLFHQLSLIQMVEREDPEAWKGIFFSTLGHALVSEVIM